MPKTRIARAPSTHTKEIKDKEKREAVLALMSEYSVLFAVETNKADLVVAAVDKG